MTIAIRRTGKRAWLTGEPPYRDGRQPGGGERIACPTAPLPWARRPWPVVEAVTAFTVARSITLALEFFNVGVEIGQVAPVGVATALLLAVGRTPGGRHDPRLVMATSATASPGVRRFVEPTLPGWTRATSPASIPRRISGAASSRGACTAPARGFTAAEAARPISSPAASVAAWLAPRAAARHPETVATSAAHPRRSTRGGQIACSIPHIVNAAP